MTWFMMSVPYMQVYIIRTTHQRKLHVEVMYINTVTCMFDWQFGGPCETCLATSSPRGVIVNKRVPFFALVCF